LVFVGEIAKVGSAPSGYSGRYLVIQEVEYRVLKVLKNVNEGVIGSAPVEVGSLVRVAHPIVGGAWTTEPGVPRLRVDTFRSGARLLLFVTVTNGELAALNEGDAVATANSRTMSQLGSL
jgi:hypothetical protein